jgi:hypothetical protein
MRFWSKDNAGEPTAVVLDFDLIVEEKAFDCFLHDWCFLDTVANVSGDGRLAVARVNNAFVAFDVDLHILFAETAPALLDERNQSLPDLERGVLAA